MAPVQVNGRIDDFAEECDTTRATNKHDRRRHGTGSRLGHTIMGFFKEAQQQTHTTDPNTPSRIHA